jgi:hypothetical protein
MKTGQVSHPRSGEFPDSRRVRKRQHNTVFRYQQAGKLQKEIEERSDTAVYLSYS